MLGIPLIMVMLMGQNPGPKPTAEMSIRGELNPKPHALLRLEVIDAPADSAIIWLVTPAGGMDIATTADDLFQASAVPGTYAIKCVALTRQDNGKTRARVAECVVVVPGCGAPAPVPPAAPRSKGKRDTRAAIVRIQFGSAGCSACPIFPQRADGRWDILTAAHCIQTIGQKGHMILADGSRVAVTCDIIDRQSDVAWLITDLPTDDMVYGVLAPEDPQGVVGVWHAGFGVDKPGNKEIGNYNGNQAVGGKYQYRLSVSSGDSGGPIVWTVKDWILSPVCCTSIRGAMGDVYGGSPARCRALRPGRVSAGEPGWSPSVIPLIGEKHDSSEMEGWKPLEMPIAKAK